MSLLVESVEPSGRGNGTRSDANTGVYNLPAPLVGPYLLQIRNPQDMTVIMTVEHLTGGTAQNVSLTVAIQGQSVQGTSAKASGVSSITNFLFTNDNPRVREQYFAKVPRQALAATIDQVRGDLQRMQFLDARQRNYLIEKVETAARQLQMIQ